MNEPAGLGRRAAPGAHERDTAVWVCMGGDWRAGTVLAASADAVLVRWLMPSRGTGVDTVEWPQLSAYPRTEYEPRLDQAAP